MTFGVALRMAPRRGDCSRSPGRGCGRGRRSLANPSRARQMTPKRSARCAESFLAHIGSANPNRIIFPIWVVAPPASDLVRSFLIESERRVIVHCRKLLDDQNLPT